MNNLDVNGKLYHFEMNRKYLIASKKLNSYIMYNHVEIEIELKSKSKSKMKINHHFISGLLFLLSVFKTGSCMEL